MVSHKRILLLYFVLLAFFLNEETAFKSLVDDETAFTSRLTFESRILDSTL